MWAYIKILCLALIGKVDIVHLHTAERGSFFRKAFLVQTFNILGIKTVMHHHAAEFELFYTSLSERRKKYVRFYVRSIRKTGNFKIENRIMR